MGIFDDVLSTAKKAASAVGKGAGDVFDTGKLKVNQSEVRSDIKKAYEALGKLIYDAKLEGSDVTDQVEEAFNTISELKEKEADIETELLRLSKKIVCEKCGEVNSIESSFCSKCGAKIEQPVEEAADVEVCE